MSGDFVPEADLQEQRRALREEPEFPDDLRLGPEVPEADAVEQAYPVPMDEDEEPR